MDESLLVVGVIFVILGLAGIYIAYSGVSDTLDNGLQQFSGLLLALGIAMIPGGLLRGGLPQLSGPKIVAILAIMVILVSLVATTAALQIGPFKKVEEVGEVKETPFKVIVRIVPGSFNPQQEENYVPKQIRVIIGYNSTVIWINDDVPHTVTSEEDLFNSGLFGSGQNWTYTFSREGVYRYHCIPHPWMRGVVIAEENPELVASLRQQEAG
ncbi:MAG: plastocyanin/azurin family copper-binding protein [Aigarchaeota archaeon]|nr:plastocyanin/azurin family copper-binding protein [Candidatus Pelearchaeum maunauluense]